jgi:hypothetical protein
MDIDPQIQPNPPTSMIYGKIIAHYVEYHPKTKPSISDGISIH